MEYYAYTPIDANYCSNVNVDEPGVSFASALAAEQKGQLKQLDVSVSALARRLHAEQRTIRQWINGRNKIPLAFVYSTSLAVGTVPASLFRLAEKRMLSSTPLFVTGAIETRDRSPLKGEELQRMGERFWQCVAAELRVQLAERDISFRRMSNMLGKSATTTGDWLNGKKQLPVHFAYNVCQELGYPIERLVERAEERILRYPEDPDEAAWSLNAPSPERERSSLPPEVLGRRIRALIALRGMNEADALAAIDELAGSKGQSLGGDEWAAILDASVRPTAAVLATIGEALDAPQDYFTDEDAEVTERAEAEAALARVAADAGITNIATRGTHISAQTLNEIADLIDKYVRK